MASGSTCSSGCLAASAWARPVGVTRLPSEETRRRRPGTLPLHTVGYVANGAGCGVPHRRTPRRWQAAYTPLPPGNRQGVDRTPGGQREWGQQCQAALACDSAGLGPTDEQFVGRGSVAAAVIEDLVRSGKDLWRTSNVERLHAWEAGMTMRRVAGGAVAAHDVIVVRRGRMASMTLIPRFPPEGASADPPAYDGPSIDLARKDHRGRTHRAVTQAPREINIEMSDDVDRAAVKSQVEAALSAQSMCLWLTTRRVRDVGVAAAKIAYVEVATAEGEPRIGFGG